MPSLWRAADRVLAKPRGLGTDSRLTRDQFGEVGPRDLTLTGAPCIRSSALPARDRFSYIRLCCPSCARGRGWRC